MAGPADATIKVKVLTEVEKSQIENSIAEIQRLMKGDTFKVTTNLDSVINQVKQLDKEIQNAIKKGDFTAEIQLKEERKGMMKDLGSTEKGIVEREAGGKKAASGGILGSLKGIGGTLLSIFGIVSIVGMVMTQFKPVFNIVKMILKVLIEFLRPIFDMVMILLMPILQILKPILVVFRALIMPFKKAALMASAQATKLIAQGDIGGGILMAMSAVQIMGTGFMLAILKGVREIVFVVIDVMNNLVKIILKAMFYIADPIVRAVSFGTANLDGVENKFMNAMDNIAEFSKSQFDNVFGASIITNLAVIKDNISKLTSDVIADSILNLGEFGKLVDSVFDKSTISFEKMGYDLEDISGTLNIISFGFKTWFEQLKSDVKFLLNPDNLFTKDAWVNRIKELGDVAAKEIERIKSDLLKTNMHSAKLTPEFEKELKNISDVLWSGGGVSRFEPESNANNDFFGGGKSGGSGAGGAYSFLGNVKDLLMEPFKNADTVIIEPINDISTAYKEGAEVINNVKKSYNAFNDVITKNDEEIIKMGEITTKVYSGIREEEVKTALASQTMKINAQESQKGIQIAGQSLQNMTYNFQILSTVMSNVTRNVGDGIRRVSEAQAAAERRAMGGDSGGMDMSRYNERKGSYFADYGKSGGY